MRVLKLFNFSLIYICFFLILTSCGTKNNTKQQSNDKKRNETQQKQINDYGIISRLNDSPYNIKIPNSHSPSNPAPSKNNESTNKILGGYKTRLLSKEENRINNVKLAAESIDGYTVQPGEIFSFNDALGRRSPEKGYKKAKIIVDGETDWGSGGGICQVSSTLYNAVQEVRLKIVERHSHSKDVYYVSPGQDATVVYGAQDFKFKNNKTYPVEIKARVTNDNVHVFFIGK